MIALITKAHDLLAKTGSHLQSFVLLALRITWGWELLESGYGHLTHVQKTVEAFKGWGVPLPTVNVYISGTRELASATISTTDPEGKPIVVRSTPLRTLYLAAGSGYAPDGVWGHGYYQGALKVEGIEHDLSSPEERRKYARLNETLSRFELDTGEVGYGMHENMLMGVYRPTGFDTADTVAP